MESPYASDLLSGRAAIVTGSTKGIGLGIAEALLDHGCDVVISSRTAGDVRDMVARLNERGGGRAVGRPCDVRSHQEVRDLVAYAVDELGKLDILVNNAGLGYFGSVEELSVEQWDQVIETNLNGVFYACHEAIPHLKKSTDAWIINIASLAGKNPFAGGTVYNASKFGLVGFSEALMMDVRHDGIRVNYIMPGSVSSYFGGGEPEDGEDWKIQPEDIGKMVLDLLAYPQRTLASRIEVRPSQPPKK